MSIQRMTDTQIKRDKQMELVGFALTILFLFASLCALIRP
jgi:hypothetical protein